MAQNYPVSSATALFTPGELRSLRAFYAGEPARLIRRRLPNPWPLVARHRALDSACRAAVMAENNALPAEEGDA